MSFLDRAKAVAEGAKLRVEEMVGGVKESVGEAYGNEALEIDGEVEADAAREREAELDAVDGTEDDGGEGAGSRASLGS